MQGRADTDTGHIGPVSGSGIGDFIELLKPRVMSLVVFTALTGMIAAPGSIHPVLGLIALFLGSRVVALIERDAVFKRL